jgi:hypothetical protein
LARFPEVLVMSNVARDPLFGGTLAVLIDGYDSIWKRCRRLHTDLFLTRVMGKRTVCIHGRDGAQLFYDESKFQRHGALPRRVVTSLFGKRGGAASGPGLQLAPHAHAAAQRLHPAQRAPCRLGAQPAPRAPGQIAARDAALAAAPTGARADYGSDMRA